MIKQYTSHAANERTYLAWIRTALAIMAFGFIVEKFSLYMERYNIPAIKGKHHIEQDIEITGIAFLILGTILIAFATIRFFITRKAIEAEETVKLHYKKNNLMLSASIILICIFLLSYLGHHIFRT